MGWPRKNDGARIYREKDGAYMLVLIANGNDRGFWDTIANVIIGPKPSLGSASTSSGYLQTCKRVQWNELPQEWKTAFQWWLKYDNQTPETIRGFWRVGNMPARIEATGAYSHF